MNKVFGLVTLGVVFGIGILLFGAFIQTYNAAIRYETTIEASYKNNQNILGQYGLKVVEVAKVSEKYSEQLKNIVTASMEGRYGQNGSQAVFQWIQEQNPTVDPSIFRNVQQVIEAGRNEFQNNQTLLLDQCRSYDSFRQQFWNQFLLGLGGFPRLDNLTKVCTPITTTEADKAFETGKATKVEF